MSDWNDAERRVEKAQELFEQRRWVEALEELRAAISINPYNGSWFFNVGLTLDEMGRYDEAIDAYHKALEIEPNDLQALTHLGINFHRIGNFQQALRTFERAEGIDPGFEPSYCNRILTYCELDQHDRAEEMFYLARLYKEHCPHCYYNMGCSLAERGLFDKAIFCWQKTLDLDESHPEVQIRIAEALWGKGELESARQHYLTGLRHDPGNTGTLLDLGGLLSDMGRDEEAGEKFRRAIELAPEEPSGYFCHAQWLVRHGREEEAVGTFAKVLQLDPTYPAVHLKLGELYYRRRELAPARKHLRAELLLRPQDPKVLMDLANLLLDTGQNRAAVACLKRLVQAEPEGVSGWQNLAIAQFMAGRYPDGIASCQEALRLEPRNATTAFNLALAYEQVRRYDEALKWVDVAVEIDPRDPSLERLRLRVRVLRWRSRATGFVLSLVGMPRRHRNAWPHKH